MQFASLSFARTLMLRRWRASPCLSAICEECCREYSIIEPAETKAAVPALRKTVLDRSLPPRLQEMHGRRPRTVCSPDGHHRGCLASVRLAPVGGGRLRPDQDLRRRPRRGSGGVMMIATLADRGSPDATKDVARPSQNVEPCLTCCAASVFASYRRAHAVFATRIAHVDCGGSGFALAVCLRPQTAAMPLPADDAPAPSARKLLVCRASRKWQPAARITR